jgi:hypothetical protein
MSQRTFGVDNPATPIDFRSGTGRTNSYPRIGPVVISEIMYHPVSDNDQLEFVELLNISANPVPLYDPAHPGNTWRMRGGIDINLPTGRTLAPGGRLVLVSFDPLANPSALATFQGTYGSGATLVGPYSGKLDNAGESIELLKPDAPQSEPGPDFGLVPYIVVDRIAYADRSPWPSSPDGTGDSLQRVVSSLYGNEPLNWAGAAPDPGSGGTSHPDIDGDGLPNSYEIQYGLDPNDGSDAVEDLDQDGVSNLHEYQSGTNPADPTSCLALTAGRTGGTVALSFTAMADRTYSVLYRSTVTSGSWSRLGDVPAGATRTVTLTDAPAMGQRFYLIVTPAVP